MTIGERIKEARERAEFSQVHLAEKLGISKQLLYKYETNKVQRVPSNIVEDVARICGIDPWDIMGWNPETHTEQKRYYLDDEASEIIEALQSNPQLATVFDATRKVKPEDLNQVLKLINTYIGDSENS